MIIIVATRTVNLKIQLLARQTRILMYFSPCVRRGLKDFVLAAPPLPSSPLLRSSSSCNLPDETSVYVRADVRTKARKYIRREKCMALPLAHYSSGPSDFFWISIAE